MSVYAEWHWSCPHCDDNSEEPFGDQYSAEDDLAHHVSEVHPETEGGGPMTEQTTCPDCGAQPNNPHVGGCDVERCKTCGQQALGCRHDAPPTTWTGEWPSLDDCRRLGILDPNGEPDLNELSSLATFGLLRWDERRERWERPAPTEGENR